MRKSCSALSANSLRSVCAEGFCRIFAKSIRTNGVQNFLCVDCSYQLAATECNPIPMSLFPVVLLVVVSMQNVARRFTRFFRLDDTFYEIIRRLIRTFARRTLARARPGILAFLAKKFLLNHSQAGKHSAE